MSSEDGTSRVHYRVANSPLSLREISLSEVERNMQYVQGNKERQGREKSAYMRYINQEDKLMLEVAWN